MKQTAEIPVQVEVEQPVSANTLMGVVVVLTIIAALVMTGVAALTGAFTV